MSGGAAAGGAEVIVVGAGIAGSALAFELARRGVETLLLERGEAGPTGASTVPAALVNPHRGRSARASSADLAGVRAFWELVEELEREPGVKAGAHRTGVLRLADNARQGRDWRMLAASLRGAGPSWLEPREIPEQYHAPFGGLLVPGGGWLESGKLLGALVSAAERRGARVAWGVELEGVEGPGGAEGAAPPRLVAAVRKARGGEGAGLACRALVIATGAERPARLPLPRLQLVRGEARTFELGLVLPYPLAGGAVAAFPSGRAVVSGGHEEVSEPGRVADEEAANRRRPDLRRALEWRVPQAVGAPELSRWEGVRARRASGEPVARRLRPGVYLLGAFGGRGFLRAAAEAARLAERLAAELGAGA